MTHFLLLLTLAQAQTGEDEWGGFSAPPDSLSAPKPQQQSPPEELEEVDEEWLSLPPAWETPVTQGRLRPRPEVLARTRSQQPRNDVSVFGATPLGEAGRRSQSAFLGFPLIDIKLLFAVASRLELGLGFDTYFFMMNQPKAVIRLNFFDTGTVSLGARLEGGYAFFVLPAPRESTGARWLSGRRNVNIEPSLVLSLQPKSARAPRVFFNLHYLMTLDFEGYALTPLGGLPPDVIVGHNGGLHAGAELPLSPATSLVLAAGLDIHGREEDSRIMAMVGLGLVTSL